MEQTRTHWTQSEGRARIDAAHLTNLQMRTAVKNQVFKPSLWHCPSSDNFYLAS
jgi:hypothetical protein